MNRFLSFQSLICGLALLVAPAVAAGQVSLRFGPVNGDPFGGLRPGLNYFDLLFTETGPTQDEALFSYDISLRISAPPGLDHPCFEFVTGPGAAALPPDRFVLPQPPPALLTLMRTEGDSLAVNVTTGGATGDIDTGDTALRVFFNFDRTGHQGMYYFQFDPAETLFASTRPGGEQAIPVELADRPGILCWPEPSAMGLLAPAAAVLALRPRRPPGPEVRSELRGKLAPC